ncbi:MAG: glycosyltransferase [Actinomycetes bacterium]
MPDVAVVVPSGRGPATAAACVAAVRQGAAPLDVDVVVVADGDAWSDPLPAVVGARLVRSEGAGPGPRHGPCAARNTGIRATTAPLVVTTDDDVRPRPGWLPALVAALRNGDAGVGGPVVAHRPSTLLGRFADWRRPLDAQLDPARTRYLVTANSLWRRAALDQVGLFDESFLAPGGEELELCDRLLRAGWTLGWAPDAVVEHEFDVGLRRFVRTNYSYGRGTSLAFARMGRTVQRRRLLRSYAGVALKRAWRTDPPAFTAVELLAVGARMVGEVRHARRR